uniref:Uncharacterized protein n=1 Tax=viral metagenome TaxID=1070528 RepID=A0A6C0BN11_9ZZZZ
MKQSACNPPNPRINALTIIDVDTIRGTISESAHLLQ